MKRRQVIKTIAAGTVTGTSIVAASGSAGASSESDSTIESNCHVFCYEDCPDEETCHRCYWEKVCQPNLE